MWRDARATATPSKRSDTAPGGSRTGRGGSRENPLSVSQFVRGAHNVIERTVGTIWLEGETNSVTHSASGHVYFALCDARAQLRCVLWKSDSARLKFQLENGLRLLCRGRPGIYERDGKFQFYAQTCQPVGHGAEALALEQLRQRLMKEGVFASERKRRVPLYPRRIGVVTSRRGAAIRDIIRAVNRRFPTPILVADAMVQGDGAAAQIVSAMHSIGRSNVDVVIVGRGGGSAADLSAFNDERVVRAVAACPVPTISAVGHEVDITLTDLAADQRAATPTMAGEMAVPVLADVALELREKQRRVAREVGRYLNGFRQEVDGILSRVHHSVADAIVRRRTQLGELHRRLECQHPHAQIVTNRALLEGLQARGHSAMQTRFVARRHEFSSLCGRLEALSPLRVLDRGYALATYKGQVLRESDEVESGAQIHVRLATGALLCRVTDVETGES